MAYECANGNSNALTRECDGLAEVSSFDDYFLTNGYNCLLVDKATKGNSLYFTLMYLTYKRDWRSVIPKFTEGQFKNLAFSLQQSYRKNHYHNAIHAADVVQNLSFFLEKQQVIEFCELNPLEIFCCLISGAAHDMDHPGTNNLFEIKNRSKLAILYNDLSVLENHHAASLFFLMENPKHDCNVFKHLTAEEKTSSRKQILENILCTDMSKHG